MTASEAIVMISIHASAWEATWHSENWRLRVTISIHASAWEATKRYQLG